LGYPGGGHGWSWSVTVGHRFSDPKIDGHLMGQQIGGHKKNYPFLKVFVLKNLFPIW